MSIPKGTILTRDQPEDDKFDKVEVVGPSPIKQASAGEWGVAGDSLIVHPIGNDEYNPPEIIPIAALTSLFTIEYEPDPAPTHLESQPPPRPARLLTPEEQFRIAAKEAARNKGKEKSDRDATGRQRTAIGGGDD